MRGAVWIGLACLTFGLGYFINPDRHMPARGSDFKATCRPSAPDTLNGQPAVLFWGNSLAFDYDWPLEGVISVNCAVQGMTAQAAVARTSALPDMDFTTVVLVFGTVELIRAPEDLDGFRSAISDITTQVGRTYPMADIVTLGVPRRADAKSPWTYEDNPQLDAINTYLQGLDGVRFVDSTQVLSVLQAGSETYDGVHFNAQSYLLLNDALQSVINEPE